MDEMNGSTPPSKKRKLNGHSVSEVSQAKTAPITAATLEEKAAWPGFCEIESNPACFNVLLKDFGVKNVKVHEVFGLEETELAFLPKPVHGLIFLYRYRADDETLQEASCPDNVWFANQVSDNSCATVALLNIINNVPGAELGPHLQSFKDFTRSFPPALRGEAVNNFEFVKAIHNSFARKMDMLNTDLALENKYDDRRKPKRTPVKPPPKGKKGSKMGSKKQVVTEGDYEEDNDFHFSAYVPIDGEIWKLDGLDRQPRKVAQVQDGSDWMSTVAPLIQDQIIAYDAGGIEFSLLGVVADPLDTCRKKLGSDVTAAKAIESRLDAVKPDWRAFITGATDASDMGSVLELPEDMVAASESVGSAENEVGESCPAKLMAMRESLLNGLNASRCSVIEAVNSAEADEREAKDRRNDYGPFIREWLSMLAEKEDLIKTLVEAIRT